MRASWQGQVVAESDDIVTVEGNAYFPRAALREDLVRSSEHTSVCGWKGTARYFSLDVGGKVNQDAVWYYPEPKKGAEAVAGRVAFWKGIQVAP